MKTTIYCRVSTDDQEFRKTIDSQIEFAIKYCDLHEIEIIDWYKDDGVTGTLPLESRPEGLRLLQDAQNKKFDTLLIYKLDRFGRSARIILNGVHQLEELGVQVRSMTEPFDTGDPAGRFLLTILAGVADLERDNILSRMAIGAERAAKAGKWLGGIVPFGYFVNDDGFLEVNENKMTGCEMSEADVIRLIFQLTVEEGMSTMRIAERFNAMQLPTRYVIDNRKVMRGKRKERTRGYWYPGRVLSILHSTTYKGIHHYGKRSKKEVISREVPAIVSKDLWDRAQEAIEDNRIEALRNSKQQYLLRGLIKCGSCGMTYGGTPDSRRNKRYYACFGKTKYHGPIEKCRSKNVSAEWIEELVWNECVNFILSPGEAVKKIKDDHSEKIDYSQELQLIEEQLFQKQGERTMILDAYRRNVISEPDMIVQVSRINTEQTLLEQHELELKKAIATSDRLDTQQSEAIKLLTDLHPRLKTGDPLSFEEKRAILKLLINEIRIHTIEDPDCDELRRKVKVTIDFSISRCSSKLLTTRTGISGSDQQKRGREAVSPLSSSDGNMPLFQGLTQYLQHLTRKLRQFVKK